jgi:hypothetical protein
MRNEAAGKALETTNLILGVGLACAAFVFTEVPAAAWNAGIVGADSMLFCRGALSLQSLAGMVQHDAGVLDGGRSVRAWLRVG